MVDFTGGHGQRVSAFVDGSGEREQERRIWKLMWKDVEDEFPTLYFFLRVVCGE